MERLPNITGLRFLLAVFVVIFHVPQFCRNYKIPFYDDAAVFHKGPEAVYVFFILSGFLIIRQLSGQKKVSGTISLRTFFARRMRRIFPVYYLVLLFGLAYYRLILPGLGYHVENNYDLWEGLVLSIFFFPNIFDSLYKPGGIIEILWSIGIEEQFYLVIAPLMLFLPDKKLMAFLLFFTLAYFGLFFSGRFELLGDFQMYFFYFSAGGIASQLLGRPWFSVFLKFFRFPVLILALLYFFTPVFTEGFSEPGYHFFGICVLPLLVSVLCGRRFWLLDNKAAVYLGKISYGIYMYHAIFIQLAGFLYLKFMAGGSFSTLAAIVSFNISVLGMTVLAAHFSYQYYEKFFLGGKPLQPSGPK